MSWNLASQDRTVALNLDVSDNGPLTGSLSFEGRRFPVAGSWVASFSVPGRNYSAFAVAGYTQDTAPAFIAAAGIMSGPGHLPDRIDIQVDVSSAADGVLRHRAGVLLPV